MVGKAFLVLAATAGLGSAHQVCRPPLPPDCMIDIRDLCPPSVYQPPNTYGEAKEPERDVGVGLPQPSQGQPTTPRVGKPEDNGNNNGKKPDNNKTPDNDDKRPESNNKTPDNSNKNPDNNNKKPDNNNKKPDNNKSKDKQRNRLPPLDVPSSSEPPKPAPANDPKYYFPCSRDAYLIQNRTLFLVNMKTGTNTTVAEYGAGRARGFNAMGYNPYDNNLYGLQGKVLVRMKHEKGVLDVEPVLSTHLMGKLGDFDGEGKLWLSERGTKVMGIYLRDANGYGEIVKESDDVDLHDLPIPKDWAHILSERDYMYALSVLPTSTHPVLMRFHTKTFTWEKVYDLPQIEVNQGATFGASVGSSDGWFYAIHNGSGRVLRMHIKDPRTAGWASETRASRMNDAARCFRYPDWQ